MSGRRLLVLLVLGGLPRVATAAAFEVIEQSPAGIATAGAQVARAEDPAAVYYNPAGLAFQRGGAVLGGATITHQRWRVATPGGVVDPAATTAVPTVYAAQRIGSHLAVGIGVFSNFWQAMRYPIGWSARAVTTQADLATLTINPSVAIRPLPQLAIGFGLDVVPAKVELRSVTVDPATLGERELRLAGRATGLGANVGVIAHLWRRYLTVGVSYRSTTDLDLSGLATQRAVLGGAAIDPIVASSPFRTTLALPHNLSFGVAARPTSSLTLSVDVHWSLFRELEALAVDFDEGDPQPRTERRELGLRDAIGVRLGLEQRLVGERLAIRLGGGFDTSSVRGDRLTPLFPDGDRALVGAGLGYRHRAFCFEVGYLATLLPRRTAIAPELAATVSAVGHTVGLALTVRAEVLGGRIDEPDYKR